MRSASIGSIRVERTAETNVARHRDQLPPIQPRLIDDVKATRYWTRAGARLTSGRKSNTTGVCGATMTYEFITKLTRPLAAPIALSGTTACTPSVRIAIDAESASTKQVCRAAHP